MSLPGLDDDQAPARIRVVAAVIQRDDEVLLCRRPLHKRHGGLWEFPGGKCEPGESDAQAVRRELMEELGVEGRASGPPLFTAMDPGSKFEILFIPATIEGEPRCHEHVELRWVTQSDARLLDLAPSDRAFVEGTMPLSDAWVVRDGWVHLHRAPNPEEPLPQVEEPMPPRPMRVGGGRIYGVKAPDGSILAYPRGTE